MLRSFRLVNHRSFADEQELLLMPATKSSRSVVPVTAIYGANASGKSNLLSGLMFMHSAVLQSFARWEIEGNIPRQPFRLRSECRELPSSFVIEIVVDGVAYTYGFTLDDDSIHEEWLYSYPEKRRRVLFERVGSDIKFGSTVADLKSRLEVLEELTRPNALFLSAAARTKLAPIMPVYDWFRSSLRIRWQVGRTFRLAEAVQRFINRRDGNINRLLALLAAADVGITGLRVEEADDPTLVARLSRVETRLVEAEEDDPQGNLLSTAKMENLRTEREYLIRQIEDRRAELKFIHGSGGELFGLAEESAGTRSWLELLPIVLEALELGSVVVVDEIDTSLHPLLTAQLVGLFQDADTNQNNAQLIFTTHDTTLLGTMVGDSVLERDQIWFVEKGRLGASSLYALTDFKPRSGQNTERRYLGGSYGAVPVLDSQEFADAVLKS
ncbi:hypothetical protein EV193_108109 [Herbihabitans rhizosphaerae]|uniref:ATPase AAA-type core domain-containing protein n=1 Tax=Herbihabitans rhizosphaerae TaxID=1872711 RepID=A0A4Q7KIK3_9PSEU|nr:ATP-binding protein [Herbihabitans rhizosphaerae]RZS34761.1 hypothetical protein EV193_108109 [Herbihabitans rhizosphaerae]